MKILILTLMVFLGQLALAVTVNSSSTKLNVYGVWLSPNADCSAAVNVSKTTAPVEIDINSNPTLGSGTVAAGTYKCVILKVDSVIKFKPAASDGVMCTAGTEYTFNICVATNTVNTSQDPDTGATINCTGTSSADVTGDTIFIYVSRNSLCTGTLSTDPACTGFPNAFLPPNTVGDANRGFKLSTDIVISGNTNGTFVFNTDNQIDTNGGVCDLEGFDLSYQ